MTDPQVAMLMMGFFIVSILLGFPICFTLVAMARASAITPTLRPTSSATSS